MLSDEQKMDSHEPLMQAVQDESRKFQKYYLWLRQNMHQVFFDEMSEERIMLVTRSLMGLHLQEYFSKINLGRVAIVLCLDSADADERILKNYALYGIKDYITFVSKGAFQSPGTSGRLRVGVIYFTEAIETIERPVSKEVKENLRVLIKKRQFQVSDLEFDRLMKGMNTRFLSSQKTDNLLLGLDMFFRAKTRDHCQYEVLHNHDWKEKNLPSMQVVLAWRNTPKSNFLYRLARTVYQNGLVMRRANATYIDPYSNQRILIMSFGLEGASGEAAWEAADIADFLKQLVTLKYFETSLRIEKTFIESRLLSGTFGCLLTTIIDFIHQVLVHLDPHLYTLEAIEEGLCRHPELTLKVCEAFEVKFHPDKNNLERYEELKVEILDLIERLDTGHEINDIRRKHVLRQSLYFVEYCLKTNYYRNNKTAYSFRLDPHYLDEAPFEREKLFPVLPYAIFFIKGMHFIGFHIRFKDLARGGLRTVIPEKIEQRILEQNNVFIECYNLAYTQQRKNKDIPEGGAKGIIFLEPYERLATEGEIYTRELKRSGISEGEVEVKLGAFLKEWRLEYLYQAQRGFVNSLLTLVNCDADGTLRAKNVIDYWKRPEYIYLGPDEHMHDHMIQWIAEHSKHYDYKPKGAFISGKGDTGINHKEYGVTSLGVNVCMEEVLKYMGINPAKETFTVKMTGGPDGDVAGNQLCNLYQHYPKTAKLIALTDGSGAIYDPKGVDLKAVVDLFKEGKPIRFYPPEKLSEGAFLLDKTSRRFETEYTQRTLCWRKKKEGLVEDWLSGNDMHSILRYNVHRTPADIFIPGGGRPKTLNDKNYQEFLDGQGRPTARAIIEGANLYLTPEARRALEKLGVLIIKDSSANKCGVICSSFEVLSGLTLTEQEFISSKPVLVEQIKELLRRRALDEAQLMLRTHKETGRFLTDISDEISLRINTYTDQLLAYLEGVELSNDTGHALTRCFLNYCPEILRREFSDKLLHEVPSSHKKAIIACHIASRLVYRRGLNWTPSIIDILPVLWADSEIV